MKINDKKISKSRELNAEAIRKVIGGGAIEDFNNEINKEFFQNMEEELQFLNMIMEQYTRETGKSCAEDVPAFQAWVAVNYPQYA